MILKLIGPLILMVIVSFAEWSEIRSANFTGKLVFFLLLAVSCILWLYATSTEHPARPGVLLEAIFKYLDPFT